MKSLTPLRVSAPVRRRPSSSIEEIRKEKENNPPFPPLSRGEAIVMAFDYDRMPLVVRQLRVQHGSKRQRDLAAVRMAEELQRLQTVDAGSSCEALRAWVVARKKLRRRLGAWSIGYRSYIRPLRPLGLDGDALVLDGGEYTKRRYSHLIGEALDGTGYAKVHFVSPEGRG